MAWVTPVVEINFADLDATANWVDVTAYVKDISTSSGRSSELDNFSGASLTLTLHNEDRRFDPAHTSSPYYPNVKPRRKIRVRSTPVATTYDLFTGYISGWPQATDFYSQTAEVKLDCYDAFGILGQQKLNGSAYKNYIASLAPDVWYRFNDSADDSLVLEEYGRSSMTAYGTARLADDSDNSVADTKECVYFDGYKGGIRTDENLIPEFWDFGSIMWTAKAGDRAAYAKDASSTLLYMDATLWDMGAGMRCNLDMPDETVTGNLGYRGRPYVQLPIPAGAGATATVNGTASMLDGRWHHFALTFDGTSLKFFIDGINVDTSLAFSTYSVTGNSPTVFGERAPGIGLVTRGFIGHMADWCLIPFVMAPSTVAEAYQAWLGFPGQLSSERAAMILDFAGWSLTDRELYTTETKLKAIDLFSGTVLDNLHKLAETENGGFYMKPNGQAKLRTRYELITDSPASVATFGDGAGENRYVSAEMTMDEAFIFNEATFGLEGHKAFTIYDADSQSKYGPRAHPERTGLLSLSDNDAISGAEYVIQNYAVPLARVPQVVIDARVASGTFALCSSLKLGDRITVKQKPQNVGTAWSVDTYIESIRHAISLEKRTWITTFGLNQKGAKNTNYARFGAWIMGTNPLGW